jgi:hypothetical protein
MTKHFLDDAPYDFSRGESQAFYAILVLAYEDIADAQYLLEKCAFSKSEMLSGVAPNVFWQDTLKKVAKRGITRKLMVKALADTAISAYHVELLQLTNTPSVSVPVRSEPPSLPARPPHRARVVAGSALVVLLGGALGFAHYSAPLPLPSPRPPPTTDVPVATVPAPAPSTPSDGGIAPTPSASPSASASAEPKAPSPAPPPSARRPERLVPYKAGPAPQRDLKFVPGGADASNSATLSNYDGG